MKQANLWRGIFLLVLAAFFLFRYWQLGAVTYLFYIAIFATTGLLSVGNILPSGLQNIILNLGIALFFLDFVFAKINLSEVAQTLVNANYLMFIPSTVLVLAHLVFRTMRWQWLLKPLGDVSFWPAFRGLVIGITGNTVLPARAGEFLRAYVLGRSTGLSKTGIFATLVVERLFDMLTVLLILAAVMLLGTHDEILQTAGVLGGVLFVGVVAGLTVFMTRRQWIDMLINKFLPQKTVKPVTDLLDGFETGLTVLKNPRQLTMVILWNILTWLVIPFSFWFVLLAFDFGVPVPWQAALLMLPMLALGLTIPGPPGGVGVVQAAAASTLYITFAGLPVASNFEEVVGAVAILIHVSQLLPEVIPGIISFVVEGLSTKDITAGRNAISDKTI